MIIVLVCVFVFTDDCCCGCVKRLFKSKENGRESQMTGAGSTVNMCMCVYIYISNNREKATDQHKRKGAD